MSNDSRLNFGVAFNIENRGWAGGQRYFQNLFHALQHVDANQSLSIHVLYAQGLSREYFQESFPTVQYFHEIPLSLWSQRLFSRPTVRHFIRNLPIRLPIESPSSKLARRLKLDVLLTFSDFEFNYRLPILYWLPDMQHVKLPGFFSQEELTERNDLYRLAADHASSIIFSSQSSADDFKNWYPQHPCGISIQRFTAQMPVQVFESDPAWVCNKYHLPNKFLFLPNQFWKHKNHQVVIDALHLLKDAEPELKVVCSGDLSDYRHPDYFSDLVRRVSELGLRERVIFLGAVPLDDLYALMRQAVAIIQPSLFEGWSTTVEEVKSLGKRIVLSDIPVHREQNPPCAEYFSPSSSEALAKAMLNVYSTIGPGPDSVLEKQAQAVYEERLAKFGKSYFEMLYQVAKKS